MTQVDWGAQVVLVTGGTGSFGKKFAEIILREYKPKKLIIFSRDELKQHEMRQVFPDVAGSPVRYFIGDVRDRDRLRRAMHGVDIVIHAAALKQVPACEYNPIEAVLTNIDGTRNVIDAALDADVSRIVGLSTDKAVNPINLYGATKLVAEKLLVQANAYSGTGKARFSCVRYGNVVGSRGSVVPIFREQRQSGMVTVTDERMTRFWITLRQGVELVIHCLEHMKGGEVFVPKIPSMKVTDLAEVLAPNCELKPIGIRAGEKLHEVLISEDEARHTLELNSMYIVQPTHPWWQTPDCPENARRLPDGFVYSSNNNDQWLLKADLIDLLEESER